MSNTELSRDDNNVPVGYKYRNITTATTTVVKAGTGVLHLIVENTPANGGTITIYDNTAGSGDKIATVVTGTNILSKHLLFDVKFNKGLTIVTSGTAQDITVSYI